MYVVVEGKSDTAKLKSIIPSIKTIETNGSEISKETLELIKKVNENEVVIVFTDPDGPGKKIRQKIIEAVPSCKHAFAIKQNSIKNGKVGVAEASREEIIRSLESFIEFKNNCESIS